MNLGKHLFTILFLSLLSVGAVGDSHDSRAKDKWAKAITGKEKELGQGVGKAQAGIKEQLSNPDN